MAVFAIISKMNFFRRIPILVWFIVPTIIIIAVGVWFFTTNPAVLGEKTDSDKPLAVSNPVEGTQEFEIVGRNHIASGTPGSGYVSNPPTSGPHWSSPAKNGIYDKQLPDEQIIHDLEHGYVWISYKVASQPSEATQEASAVPAAPDDVINELKKIVEADNWKVILSPRDKNDTMIVLAAWGRLLKLENADYDKVRDFIKTYRNRGPEKTPE